MRLGREKLIAKKAKVWLEEMPLRKVKPFLFITENGKSTGNN